MKGCLACLVNPMKFEGGYKICGRCREAICALCISNNRDADTYVHYHSQCFPLGQPRLGGL